MEEYGRKVRLTRVFRGRLSVMGFLRVSMLTILPSQWYAPFCDFDAFGFDPFIAMTTEISQRHFKSLLCSRTVFCIWSGTS